jgi:hypothetical protein
MSPLKMQPTCYSAPSKPLKINPTHGPLSTSHKV